MLHLLGMSHAIAILSGYSTAYKASPQDLRYLDKRDRPASTGELSNSDRQNSQLRYVLVPIHIRELDVAFRNGNYYAQVPEDSAQEWRALHASCRAPAQANIVFCAIKGQEEVAAAIPVNAAPFDFILPDHPDIPNAPGAQILPVDMVRQMLISSWAIHAMSFYVGLRQTMPDTRLVHVFPPPPKGDDVFFYDRYFSVGSPDRRATECPFGVNAAPQRLKFSLLYREVMREGLRQMGVDWIDSPAASTDADGYLRPEYYLDAIHANAAYGALVLDQMEAYQSAAASGR